MYTYNLKDGCWFARRKLKLFKDVQRRYGIVNIIFYHSIGCTERDETIPDPRLPSKNKLLKHTKQIKLFHLKKSDKDSV